MQNDAIFCNFWNDVEEFLTVYVVPYIHIYLMYCTVHNDLFFLKFCSVQLDGGAVTPWFFSRGRELELYVVTPLLYTHKTEGRILPLLLPTLLCSFNRLVQVSINSYKEAKSTALSMPNLCSFYHKLNASATFDRTRETVDYFIRHRDNNLIIGNGEIIRQRFAYGII